MLLDLSLDHILFDSELLSLRKLRSLVFKQTRMSSRSVTEIVHLLKPVLDGMFFCIINLDFFQNVLRRDGLLVPAFNITKTRWPSRPPARLYINSHP